MMSLSGEQQQGISVASSFSKPTPFVSADAQEAAAAAGSKGASPADAAPVLSADMRSASMRQAPALQQDKMFLRPSFTSVESLDTIKVEEVVEV